MPICFSGHPSIPEKSTVNTYTYFWSFNVKSGTWCNEASVLNNGNFTNMPVPRTEFPAVALGGDTAIVFGGYHTTLMRRIDNTMLKYSYLADTFVYEADSNTWNYVCVVEEWPSHRAGSTLVYVPPACEVDDGKEGAGSASASKEKAGSGGSNSAPKAHKQRQGRVLLLGGYSYGPGFISPMPMDDVWELALWSGPKHVHTACWGCGKVGSGMRQCAGSCGGAMVMCGVECQSKAWNDGHKHWCKKME